MKQEESVSLILSANPCIKDILYSSFLNPSTSFITALVDPLQVKWCHDIFPTTIVNPRLNFSAAGSYATSLWRNGFLDDTPLLLNCHTEMPSVREFSSSHLHVVYGYDGATRLLAIKMCNLMHAWVRGELKNNNLLPPGLQMAEFQANPTPVFDFLFSAINSTSGGMALLDEWSNISPLPHLLKVPARIAVNRSVSNIHMAIVNVNTVVPLSEIAMVRYVSKLLTNWYSFDWILKSFAQYADISTILAISSLPPTLFQHVLEQGEPVSIVHKRMSNFIFSLRAVAAKEVFDTHISNLITLQRDYGIIELNSYVESYCYVNSLNTLSLSPSAVTHPDIVIAKGRKTEQKREKIEDRFFVPIKPAKPPKKVNPKMSFNIANTTLAQRTSFLAGRTSKDLHTIESRCNKLFVDTASITLLNSPQTVTDFSVRPMQLKVKDVRDIAEGLSTTPLFFADKEVNRKFAISALYLMSNLTMFYFMSVRGIDTSFIIPNVPLEPFYDLPPPSYQWRQKVETEYNFLAGNGMSIQTIGDNL
jgi:hypothetical protein